MRLSLAIFALAAAVSALAGFTAASISADRLQSQAEAALKSGGWEWAQTQVDGFQLTISGEAPDEEARSSAITLISRFAQGAGAGLIEITDETSARRPAAEAQKALAGASFSLFRGPNDAWLTGAAPQEALDAISAELEAARPALPFTSFAGPSETTRGGGWESVAEPAAAIAGALLIGRMDINTSAFIVSGLAPDQPAMERISAALAKLEEAGWEVASSVVRQQEPKQAFQLRAQKSGGVISFEACLAPSKEDAARLTDFADGADCVISGGAPAGWTDAAEAALFALAALPAGEISLSETALRLTGRSPATDRDLHNAALSLRDSAPKGFTIAALMAPGDPGAPAAAAIPAPVAEPVEATPLLLSYDGEKMSISGAAPDELIAESLSAFARAALPGAEVSVQMEPGGDAPAGWREAAAGLISALAALEDGEGRIEDGQITLSGAIADPLAIYPLLQALEKDTDGAFLVQSRLRVSPARIAASAPIPLSRCASEMTAIAAQDPIRFAPGSGEIDGNEAVISKLSAALRRCEGGRIEVAGHTDSQGRESTNLRLSQERADAVMSALVAAGAPLSMLRAKGYGEETPIAPNNTEAGRAKNRRIEFNIIREEETP